MKLKEVPPIKGTWGPVCWGWKDNSFDSNQKYTHWTQKRMQIKLQTKVLKGTWYQGDLMGKSNESWFCDQHLVH